MHGSVKELWSIRLVRAMAKPDILRVGIPLMGNNEGLQRVKFLESLLRQREVKPSNELRTKKAIFNRNHRVLDIRKRPWESIL